MHANHSKYRKFVGSYANFLSEILSEYFAHKETSTIVQIGANDGRINDVIFEPVRNFRERTRILLVEPQYDVIPYLRQNYANHPNAVICNAAIGPDAQLTLYRLKPELYDVFIRRYLNDSPAYRVPTGFTSSIKQHVYNHIYENLPPTVSLEDAIDEIKVPCYHLIQLIRQIGWETYGIDLLQIDTEGMDDIVILACNIDALKPTLINFEYCHLPTNRLNALFEYLGSLGYFIYQWSASDALAVRKGYYSVFFDKGS